MTGLFPTSSGVYLNNQPWRPVLPDAVTLPRYFMAHGYQALGAGKIYHGWFPDPGSWNEYFPSQTKNRPDDRPLNGIPDTRPFDWGPVDVAEAEMGDAQVADWVIGKLHEEHDQPFFLASGFYRPHLPWYVPPVYFDRHPLDSVELPKVLENDLEDVPPAGIAMARREDHKNVIEHDQWQRAVQGYLASIEFADAQVGRVIDALEQSAHSNDTIIVLWSDHGWHLGEKSHWRKFALWERSTRVTFLVVVPGVTEPGGRSPRPVNLVDLYPTLVDLAGLPAPSGLDGVSLRPLLSRRRTQGGSAHPLPPTGAETTRCEGSAGATSATPTDRKSCTITRPMIPSGTISRAIQVTTTSSPGCLDGYRKRKRRTLPRKR